MFQNIALNFPIIITHVLYSGQRINLKSKHLKSNSNPETP